MITRENHEWDDALGMSPTPWHPQEAPVSDQDYPPYGAFGPGSSNPPPQFGGGMMGTPIGPQQFAPKDCKCIPGEECPWRDTSDCPHQQNLTKQEESVCAEADRLTSTERGHNYGPPIDDFGKVVGMAQALWGRGPETEEEHALYMILVKLSRLANNPKHRDSLVDIAGYSKTYEMILDARKKDPGFA